MIFVDKMVGRGGKSTDCCVSSTDGVDSSFFSSVPVFVSPSGRLFSTSFGIGSNFIDLTNIVRPAMNYIYIMIFINTCWIVWKFILTHY